MAGAKAEGLARAAAIACGAGAIAIIAGSFGSWAKLGGVSVGGFGTPSADELTLYPQLDSLFTPGWLTLALGVVALASLLLYFARGLRPLALLADLAGTGALGMAIVSIVDITGSDAAGAAPDAAWGVIAVAIGGLLCSFGGTALFVTGGPSAPLSQ